VSRRRKPKTTFLHSIADCRSGALDREIADLIPRSPTPSRCRTGRTPAFFSPRELVEAAERSVIASAMARSARRRVVEAIHLRAEIEWLAWPPPLLRTRGAVSAGTVLFFLGCCEADPSLLFGLQLGSLSSAAFRFVT